MMTAKAYSLTLAGVVVTVGLISESALAQDGRHMLVLIDASGSMGAIRTDGRTRFQAACDLSKERIDLFTGIVDGGFAVYTFQNSSATPQTAGYVDAGTAKAAIDGLPGPGGLTPLAGSACDSVDVLVAHAAAGNRILQVSSDGMENNTPTSHPCYGAASTIDTVPFDPGSWHNLVYNKAVANVTVQVDVFDNDSVTNFAAFDLETGASLKSFTPAGAPTLQQFWTAVAQDSGGEVRVVADNAPAPVLGDFNGDYCVDNDDVNALVVRIGLTVPPADGAYDLNADQIIDFNDYLILTNLIGNGCSVAAGRSD